MRKPSSLESSCLIDRQNGGQFVADRFRQTSMRPPWCQRRPLTEYETACARLIAMEQPSKRAQFVSGMRAYSAHNRLHVNAPALCRFAQSYIIGSNDVGESPGGEPRGRARTFTRAARNPLGGVDCDVPRRTRPLFRSATPVPSPAWPNIENESTRVGEEAGTQFGPGTRAYSAHNRSHVNAAAPCRFARSYMIHNPFGARTRATTKGRPGSG